MTDAINVQEMMNLVTALSDNLEAQSSVRAQSGELAERGAKLESQFTVGLNRLKELCMRQLRIDAYPADMAAASPKDQLGFLTRACETLMAYASLHATVH
jgi:hypothetical protein